MAATMKLEFPEHALRPIGANEIDRARALAADSPRHRALVRYHDHEEGVQRMVNAVEPRSYVRPHKHESPDKVEVFVALAGRALVCTFDDEGRVRERIEISASGPCRGVEIPARTWHSLLALEPGTALFEVIEGPFTADSHKSFAPWAPPEGTPESARFHAELRARLGLLPLPESSTAPPPTKPRRRGRKRMLFLGLLAGWTAVVTTFSGDRFSSMHTSRFLRPLLAWLLPHLDRATFERLHFLIRKGAHVTEYAILAALAYAAARAGLQGSSRASAAFAFLYTLLIASLDELGQSYSAARGGQPADVALDMAGGLLGLLFVRALELAFARNGRTASAIGR
jgi:cupin fold WbuC family metalloprotein